MNSNSKHVNQSSTDVEDSEQLLRTKIQHEKLNSLMESNNDIKKSLHDLKNLVMSQSEDKSQNVQGIETINNCDNAEELNFEPPTKRIKLEGQSEEIESLNQVIKDLKEDNLKLSSMNAKLFTENENFKKLQKQSEATVKKLRKLKKKQSEEISNRLETQTHYEKLYSELEKANKKLRKEINDLKLKNAAIVEPQLRTGLKTYWKKRSS